MVEMNIPILFTIEMVTFNIFSWILVLYYMCINNNKNCSSTMGKHYIKYFEESRDTSDMIPTSMPLVLNKSNYKNNSQERKKIIRLMWGIIKD